MYFIFRTNEQSNGKNPWILEKVPEFWKKLPAVENGLVPADHLSLPLLSVFLPLLSCFVSLCVCVCVCLSVYLQQRDSGWVRWTRIKCYRWTHLDCRVHTAINLVERETHTHTHTHLSLIRNCRVGAVWRASYELQPVHSSLVCLNYASDCKRVTTSLITHPVLLLILSYLPF